MNRLFELLIDPSNGTPLELNSKANCLQSRSSSQTRYEIRENIPRFVPAENYCESFGFQWNLYSKTELDSSNGASYTRRRFEAETGWTDEELKGKWVLDAGCGQGRFAEIAADPRERTLFAWTFSSAIDAAKRNLAFSRFPSVHYVQGDILALPFRPSVVRLCLFNWRSATYTGSAESRCRVNQIGKASWKILLFDLSTTHLHEAQ